jgi:hypothetical protein
VRPDTAPKDQQAGVRPDTAPKDQQAD